MTILLGSNTVGTDGVDFIQGQVMIGSKYVASATGYVDHVWVRTNENASGTLSGDLACGIYDDSAGTPGSLIGSVDTVAITTHVRQWWRSVGGMAAPVTSGTTYWIIFDLTGTAGGAWYFSLHDSATSGGTKDTTTGQTTLATPWPGTTGTFNELMNAYAENAPISSGRPLIFGSYVRRRDR